MDDADLNDTLRRAIDELRRPVRLGAGLEQRVLGEVRRRRWARAADWLVRPRLSPLGGLVWAAAAAAVVLALVHRRPPRGTADGGVQFALVAPGAHTVTVVGDFNDWDPAATPLRPVAGPRGVWSVQVPLHPGRHEYAFVVDGRRWMPDPAAPRSGDDDFGTPNSVVTVS